jgi:clan AA aspartic protease
MRIQSRYPHGRQMGQIHADFVLTNFDRTKQVPIRALVDTGATEIIVTPQVARQLGFDLDEVSQVTVTLADGRRILVPRLRGVEIHFAERSYLSEAVVLDGGECLVGVVPLEVMDLIVDPKREQLVPNPAHPDGPWWRA